MSDTNEALAALNLKLVQDFGSAMDLSADIVQATRKQVHDLIEIRQRYIEAAELIYEIIEDLAVSAKLMTNNIGDLLSAELGLEEVRQEEDEDYEEEDEDE